jgi:hypothetical protein
MSFSQFSKKAVNLEGEPESVESRVERLFLSAIEQTTQTDSKIRIGIEIEFFIERLSGETVTIADATHFMRTVSQQAGWRLFAESGYEDVISKVSFEVSGVGYHSLKFEHPPHMLEVALAPYDNLHDLNEALLDIWNTFQTAAKVCGLKLKFDPSVKPFELDWNAINQFSSKYRALAITREKAVTESLRREPWVHFATYTAATQFHIGGTTWWSKGNNLVNDLYLAELFASHNAYTLLNVSSQNIHERFFERWGGYFKVFKDLKLLGFPDLKEWSTRTWIQEFCRSSLVLVQEDPFFGRDLQDIGEVLSDGELLRAMGSVRDLQIIKPKFFGTLEFRADPALPDVASMLRQAAFRFGLYHHILANGSSDLDKIPFVEMKERWRSGLDISGLESVRDLMKMRVFEALKLRGLGEEDYL